jgi:hypothetical protein
MSEYAKIWQRIWDDPDFVALPLQTQAVYFMLISDPGRTNAGLLPLTINRWTRCSAATTPDTIRGILNELSARNFIVVDWDHEELLIRTFIRNDQGYQHPNIHKSMLRAVAKTRSSVLKSVLAEELLRLPHHSCIKQTHEAADMLVKDLKQSRPDPIEIPSQSDPEPNAILRVEGCYVSREVNNLQPSTSNPQPPLSGGAGGAPPEPEPDATPTRKNGTRLQPGWKPTKPTIQAMKTERPDVDLQAEHRKFIDHWTAKTGRDATKLDWDATWRNWIRNARGTRTPTPTNGKPHKMRTLAELTQETAAEENRNTQKELPA